MVHNQWQQRFAGFVGNILEHYDTALFGLLVPFIAPLFFDNSDPLTALILTYGILPVGILTKPLGAIVFGKIGDLFGRKQALSFSLIGMSVATFSIGCIPTYSEIGLKAPLLLAVLRSLQTFFAAGEATGGAIFVLENSERRSRPLLSSFYDSSSIAGFLLASILVTILSYYESVESSWRYLYFIGAFTALIGIYFRLQIGDIYQQVKRISLRKTIKEEKSALIKIILASSFSHITYILPLSLMNGFVPLITNVTKAELMQINTALLLVDMFLLPIFGYLAFRFGKEKVMLGGALFSCFGAIPLFLILPGASFVTVALVRLLIVISGIAFAAPYYAWAMEQVPVDKRYTIMALGSAIASQFVAAPASSISLFIFRETGWVFAPGLYLLFGALGAIFSIRRERGQSHIFNPQFGGRSNIELEISSPREYCS